MNHDAHLPHDPQRPHGEPPAMAPRQPRLSATTLQAAQDVSRHHLDRTTKAAAERVPAGLPRADVVASGVDVLSVMRRTDPPDTTVYKRAPVPSGIDSTKETP